MANLILWADETIFGKRFGLYFLSYFLSQTLAIALLFVILCRLEALPSAVALGTILFAVNPAFVGSGLFESVCQFDVWAEFFVLAALLSVLNGVYWAAAAAVLLSVFTRKPRYSLHLLVS